MVEKSGVEMFTQNLGLKLGVEKSRFEMSSENISTMNFSTPDFSTPDFSIMNFPTPDFSTPYIYTQVFKPLLSRALSNVLDNQMRYLD